MTVSNKIKQRFVKDYNLPINIFDEELFSYYMNLYDFFPFKEWDALLETIEQKYNGNGDLWLNHCAEVRDRAIEETMASDSYKEFNSCEIYKWNFKPYPTADKEETIGERSIYTEEQDGKCFISVDLKKANFQALKYAGVIKDETYADFIKRFDGDEYIINSKYLRQVIFGKMNPGRTIKVEKYIMRKIYDVIINALPNYAPLKLFSVNSDELIFSFNSYTPFLSLRDLEEAAKKVKEEVGVDVRIERIKVQRLDIRNYRDNKIDAYIRKNLDTGEETLKKASTTFFPQIYKMWKRMTITDEDLMFFFEDQVCKFNNPLKIIRPEEVAVQKDIEEMREKLMWAEDILKAKGLNAFALVWPSVMGLTNDVREKADSANVDIFTNENIREEYAAYLLKMQRDNEEDFNKYNTDEWFSVFVSMLKNLCNGRIELNEEEQELLDVLKKYDCCTAASEKDVDMFLRRVEHRTIGYHDWNEIAEKQNEKGTIVVNAMKETDKVIEKLIEDLKNENIINK